MFCVQLVLTRLSLRTRSAANAASPFRAATSPARLAMLRPSSATGITIAMNTSAAITSASVNPAAEAQVLPWLGLARCPLVWPGANLIIQPVAGLLEGEGVAVAAREHYGFRAAVANRTV